MFGKLFATGIVGFWMVMTAALVRLEFFPQPRGLTQVPAELVVRKIFTCEDPTARLNVFYQGQTVGFCKLEFSSDAATSTNSPLYRVQSELTLSLSSGGSPSRLRLAGESFFDSKFEMDSFAIKTTVGEGRMDVRGDIRSNKVILDYAFGSLRDRREFDFKQMQAAGLAGAMGLPGMAGLGMSGAAPALETQRTGAKTHIYLTDLRVGTARLRSYLIESKMDETIWAKVWVSERGEILKVDTSAGVMMLSDVFMPGGTGPGIDD